MPTPIDWKAWHRNRAAIEKRLRDGYAPQGVAGGKGSAVQQAQRDLADEGVGKATGSWLALWLQKQKRRAARGLENCIPDWSLYKEAQKAAIVTRASRVMRRWILTGAQNEAPLHQAFWRNLLAYAHYLGADILVGGVTYQVKAGEDRARLLDGRLTRQRSRIWAAEITPHLVIEERDIGGARFCPQVNILPTAVSPLSDLMSYGAGRTAIFAHPRQHLASVPCSPGQTPPLALTTGFVTLKDYTDTKAGHKAEFHHIIGAVIAEQDVDGALWFRRISATPDGAFQDLDMRVRDGRVVTGQRVEAIIFGDLQLPFLDPDVAMASWGLDTATWSRTGDGLIDALKPPFAFYHDVLDFKSINHHEHNRLAERYRTFIRNEHRLKDELAIGALFMAAASREFCRSVIVGSNHDKFLERWLDDPAHARERDNAGLYFSLNTARHQAAEQGNDEFDIFWHALKSAAERPLDNLEFTPHGRSWRLRCGDADIECGLHGDKGANGTKGTPRGFARMATRMVIADKHSASTIDGVDVAGTSSLLDLRYNSGPSSWNHAHVVVYPNGKRAHLFVQNGRAWA